MLIAVMSTLFENIVKELILELSAEDAYTKFYSSLDRLVFNILMNGVPNITPFHTLVLNCFLYHIMDKGLLKPVTDAELNDIFNT